MIKFPLIIWVLVDQANKNMADPMSSTNPSTFDETGGSFTDKFMYKYLSAFLASMHPPPPSAFTRTPWSEYEILNTTDYSNPSTLPITLENFHTFISQSSPVLGVTSSAVTVYSRTSIDFQNMTSDQGLFRNTTAYERYPLGLPQTIAIILAGALLSIVTTGGNLMVIMSFKLEKQLQTISNYFLFSLAVADLTIGIISIPLMTFYTAEGQWTLDYTTCQFWLSIDYLMSNASVMNLLLISFDRYFSVTRPLTYRPRRTSKKAITMIMATFLISLILWPPLIIAWPYIEGKFAIESNKCMVQFLQTAPVVTLITAAAAFYGPVVIMIILYSRVYYVTKTRQKELVKLQAFHQQSVRRSDERIAVNQENAQRLISTSTALLRKASSYSKSGADSSLPGENADTEMITTIRNNSFRSSFRKNHHTHSVMQKIETEAKPWGIQALLDHFSRSQQEPRKASLASSGFEEDESFSLASCDTTSEGFPLKCQIRSNQQRTLSPSPSDYGSTLANQFVNHVRQSFMVKKKPGDKCRHLSLVPSKQRSTKRLQLGDVPPKKRQSKTVGSTCNPANSPIQELRKISHQRKARSVSRQPSAQKTQNTPITNGDQNHDTDPSVASSTLATPTAYTVLIDLGKDTEASSSDTPTIGQSGSANRTRKSSSCRGRPIVTLHENSSLDNTFLSPERAVGDDQPTVTCTSPSTRSAVRRLSSCSSAVSDATSVMGATTSPLIIANRGLYMENSSPGISRLAVSMGGIASRISSIRGASEAGGVKSGNFRHSYQQRQKRGERKQQESKAARTLSAILLAFIITWTPYNVIVCIGSFFPQAVPDVWFTFSYYLCYLNSTINPVLYALCNATFRRTFWRIMTCKWTPVRPSHRPSSHHHAAAAIAAVAVAAANRRQSVTTVTTLRA